MKRTPKNFAIWTALNSDVIYFFASGPSYYGGCQQDQDQRSEQNYLLLSMKFTQNMAMHLYKIC